MVLYCWYVRAERTCWIPCPTGRTNTDAEDIMSISHLRTKVCTIVFGSIMATAASTDKAAPAPFGPVVVRADAYALSRPLGELARQEALVPGGPSRATRVMSPRPLPKSARHGASTVDNALQNVLPSPLMPLPIMTFEGVMNASNSAYYTPSDSNGDIGPNHYVEAVNTLIQVFTRSGVPLSAPFRISTLFASLGGPASLYDDGDPIVMYDPMADRWLISQFVITPWLNSSGASNCIQSIAISQTGNPLGSYHLYTFTMPNNKMNDYPKFGVWQDGYYMTDNQFGPPPSYTWGGAGVFAFDRAAMLTGGPASYIYFDLYSVNASFGGMLPCDLDGPPPNSEPGLFAEVDDSANIGPSDAFRIWKFSVDWVTPANSTFGTGGQPDYVLPVADFDPTFTLNVPQPGTTVRLDTLSDRLMHRLQYRNFGTYETLVANHTVNVGGNHAGVRFYELRRALPAGTWIVYQQGTFAPDDANRWMGSAAMDSAGNIAIGYSVSSTSVYPSIRYAGRLATDPTNTLTQGEATLYVGSGSQTSIQGRWGDYSMLAVDPVDDSTFWYVNQYYPVTSSAGWHTRVGTFILVPEPAVFALLAAGMGLLARRRR